MDLVEFYKTASSYIDLTGDLIAEGHKARAALEKQAEEVKSLIPQVVKLMRESNFITQDNIKQAEDMLQSHSGAITILGNAIQLLKKAAAKAQEAKTASDAKAKDSRVGEFGSPDTAAKPVSRSKADEILFRGVRRSS